jgi:nucleoside-diphosphate-sugar epimerase
MDQHHLLCIGLGYSAEALAVRLARRGWAVTGTATRPDGVARIERHGFRGVPFDGTAPSPALDAAIATATHVVLSVPPDTAGDPVLRCHGPAFAASPRLTTIAYLSTIGVYGDHQGAWIDETTPPRPASERSRRRVAAEQAWLDLAGAHGKTALVFRLAGIYGPGRSQIDGLLDGTARRVVKPGQVFNRIHVADIAGLVEAAFDGTPRHTIYNGADDEPAPPQDVVAFAADLVGVPVPPAIPFEQAELSPMGASFYAESKRARNTRAKDDLGWRPLYPTYREGLTAIVAGARGGL